MKTISEFKGKYFFLSNFYTADVTYQGIPFQNNEAAFQAMKNPKLAKTFSGLNPSQAKRKGRHVQLRPDWEDVKEGIMKDICIAKFRQNPELAACLLATGDAELIEGNDWGDREWGQCNGQGKNKLGKILMDIRRNLSNELCSHKKTNI